MITFLFVFLFSNFAFAGNHCLQVFSKMEKPKFHHLIDSNKFFTNEKQLVNKIANEMNTRGYVFIDFNFWSQYQKQYKELLSELPGFNSTGYSMKDLKYHYSPHISRPYEAIEKQITSMLKKALVNEKFSVSKVDIRVSNETQRIKTDIWHRDPTYLTVVLNILGEGTFIKDGGHIIQAKQGQLVIFSGLMRNNIFKQFEAIQHKGPSKAEDRVVVIIRYNL